MLPEKDLPPYVYGDLKREELVRTGSVILHEHMENVDWDEVNRRVEGALCARLA